MSRAWSMHCDQCGLITELAPIVTGCPRCTPKRPGTLRLRFDPQPPPRDLGARRVSAPACRYRDLLPFGDRRDWVALGEGNTPLIRSRVVGPRLGLHHLFFKNETMNPTWSFKDRYAVVSINAARAFGRNRVVVSSTGNLGVSVAAYAAAADVRCLFIASHETPRGLLQEALLYGADVVCADRHVRLALFETVAEKPGWFPIGLFLPRRIQNPFGIEGYRLIAFELVEHFGEAPDAVLFPCARGNNLYGAWRGFEAALAWGWVSRLPRMIACQPVGANSLEVSLDQGLERCVELPVAHSIATSTCETVASDDALAALRASGGGAASADDAAIERAVLDLGREGLAVEASAALPVACLPALIAREMLLPAQHIVCVLTGSAPKWPAQLNHLDDRIVAFDGGTAELSHLLSRMD